VERIVYVLGAGFSAPLGIPVVRDFLLRAKDLYFSDPAKYADFHEIFQTIEGLASVKNYLNADLFDIEEVFSIIEMQRQLGLGRPDVSKFIADVVQAYTPALPPPVRGGSREQVWGQIATWHGYGAFAMALARLKPMSQGGGTYPCELASEHLRYDVVTLNYDKALELPLDQLISASQSLSPGVYQRPSTRDTPLANCRTAIMKLHGDARLGTIVPPTWDKSVRDTVRIDWEWAYHALQQANHVRILGYSFPETDTYFRYFLKAALSRTVHLKSIDVVTLDPEGRTRRRCADAFAFKFTRFQEKSMQEYLAKAHGQSNLEGAHAAIMTY
jgi:hypothetical protein